MARKKKPKWTVLASMLVYLLFIFFKSVYFPNINTWQGVNLEEL